VTSADAGPARFARNDQHQHQNLPVPARIFSPPGALPWAWTGVRPVFTSLRTEPRFGALLRQIGVGAGAGING